jgi:putative RNA 2'-phosphotransferase
MDKSLVHLSKFLSLVLRHRPETIGLQLDPQGWASIDELLPAASRAGVRLTRESLMAVVEQNDKKRFAISDDGTMIRASQGHSVAVDLALEPLAPPDLLYHGTATRFLSSIQSEGLRSGARQHVHLSSDEATARAVGIRHGRPVILRVDAKQMHTDGHTFYQSQNGVWLTKHVPPRYLHEIGGGAA